jgi:hypothetical protein
MATSRSSLWTFLLYVWKVEALPALASINWDQVGGEYVSSSDSKKGMSSLYVSLYSMFMQVQRTGQDITIIVNSQRVEPG